MLFPARVVLVVALVVAKMDRRGQTALMAVPARRVREAGQVRVVLRDRRGAREQVYQDRSARLDRLVLHQGKKKSARSFARCSTTSYPLAAHEACACPLSRPQSWARSA